MIEKKSTSSSEKISGVLGWIDFAREAFSDRVEQVLAGLLDTVSQGVENIVRKVIRSFSIFFFVLLGATFLLVGVARVLDHTYQIPGLGEIIIGVFIFSLVLLLFMVGHKISQK